MGHAYKKEAIIAAVCFIFLTSAGCARAVERDYYSATKHVSSPEQAVFPDDGISDYFDLKNAVLNLVHSGVSERMIRIGSYKGNLDDDLSRISKNLSRQDARTAYSVTSINFEQTRILTYQEIRISIQYSKSEQDMQNIVNVINSTDFEKEISRELTDFPAKLAFYLSYYSDDSFRTAERFKKAYYNNPNSAFGLSDFDIKLYPESGTERIAEINISYLTDTAELKQKSQKVSEEAQKLLKNLRSNDPAFTALNIYNYLVENVTFDRQAMRVVSETAGTQPKSDPYTSYGALVNKTASYEGYAIAYKKLCDMLGLECTVITGKFKDKTPVIWNLIKLNGEWYHVDAGSAAFTGSKADYFCIDDEAMSKTHEWNLGMYPAAEGNEYSFQSVLKKAK
ncbi:MAG: hypothetical protein Q8878_08970 [Bacillota bacterium]|nr:hypothetical protein [Bacillota bacterium]